MNIEGLQQLAALETLLAVGMIMGLAIGTAAFVVSATDRAVERRGRTRSSRFRSPRHWPPPWARSSPHAGPAWPPPSFSASG
ncbi:hypothetical protein [Streptomyces avermitilis]|uniref:hypothetical protein n=1 Tax=Streptomyces avermitilis TaxID=33903 RepID=UPI0036B764C5